MPDTFFPPKPDIEPKIYAYRDKNPSYDGFLKVGFTARDVEGRVAQQYPTKRPGELPYEILLEESAVWSDGGSFTDHDIHRYLRKRGFRNPAGEWFECEVDDVLAAILAVREGIDNDDNRTQDFKMRPEQAAAVEKTARYFSSFKDEGTNETPHFLWNAKMRFGKTFASYQLAKRMGWKRVLVLTFKPAVQNAWEDDLKSHIDFKGWQFVSRGGLSEDDVDMSRPIVCFGSFQDFLGKNSAGGIKAKNEWVHATNWDCVIFDEYHYGAWRENAKELFEAEGRKEMEFAEGEGLDYFSEENMPITTGAYLYLSGTPFRAIASGAGQPPLFRRHDVDRADRSAVASPAG